MKQPFVNATMNDKRKGKESLSHSTESFHPGRLCPVGRPESVSHSISRLPVKVVKKAEPSELDKMKEEIVKAMKAVEKKPRAVPKSKLIGMGSTEDEPTRDYADILTMLLAKK
jgi:hypothetical protein